jgi:phytoene synthase
MATRRGVLWMVAPNARVRPTRAMSTPIVAPSAVAAPSSRYSPHHRRGTSGEAASTRAATFGARRARARAQRATSTSAATVEQARAQAKETTRTYARSFYWASQFMTKGREDAYALYCWCRELDEIVDGADGADEERRAKLNRSEANLEAMFRKGTLTEPSYADVALSDTLARVEGLRIGPFKDMISGMRRDIDDARFEGVEDVLNYAYQVAGTVALMILPILTLGSVDDEQKAAKREERGVALGIALQLTNIVRDVGEDARQRGRVYIADEDLKLFELTRDDVLSMKTPTTNYMALIEYQIQRALFYYSKALEGIDLLPPLARPPTKLIAGLYQRIAFAVRENDYDNLSKRAFSSTYEKLTLTPKLLLDSFLPGGGINESDVVVDFSDASAEASIYRAQVCKRFVAARVGTRRVGS